MKTSQYYVGIPDDLIDEIREHQRRMADREKINVSGSAAIVSLLRIGVKEALRVRKGRAAA
jgi:predicted nucleic acid-binding protein